MSNALPNAIEQELSAKLESVQRLSKDIAKTASTMSLTEIRYLVAAYYTMQDSRIRTHAQLRELHKEEQPHEVIEYLFQQDSVLEQQIKRALDRWTDAQPMGIWAKNICGIGPVIAAGLLAHIDITKAPTVGHIWRYAGLDPTTKKEKGKKLQWNTQLKVLCAYKLGESFVKVSGNPNGFYGRLYQQQKLVYQTKNESGGFADFAAKKLAEQNINKATDLYKHLMAGRLAPAHIHAMARRWSVKIFLSHYHAEAYRQHYHQEPPKPFAIAILGHAHMIEPE